MTTFEDKEKYLSQIPAVQGPHAFRLSLSSQGTLESKRGRLRQVILEDILAEQILSINRFTHRGEEYRFNEGDAEEAIRRLKPSPAEQRDLSEPIRTSTTCFSWEPRLKNELMATGRVTPSATSIGSALRTTRIT